MMVSSSVSSSPLPRLISISHKLPPNSRTILNVGHCETSRRGISVVTRAGPSTTSYIFAFVFPISLLAATIFTSIKIADKLDEKFNEELALNQAILEAEEYYDDDDDDDDDDSNNNEQVPKKEPTPTPTPIPPGKETTPTRRRNRPIREVEPSSM